MRVQVSLGMVVAAVGEIILLTVGLTQVGYLGPGPREGPQSSLSLLVCGCLGSTVCGL